MGEGACRDIVASAMLLLVVLHVTATGWWHVACMHVLKSTLITCHLIILSSNNRWKPVMHFHLSSMHAFLKTGRRKQCPGIILILSEQYQLNYCSRFAQSARPRPPLLWEFGTPFDTIFVLWDHFWRTWGTLFPLKMKKGHPGQPIVIFPDSNSHFGRFFEGSFWTWIFSWCFFHVVAHSLFWCLLVYFMVSGTLQIRQNQRRVVQNRGSLEM